MKKFLMSALSVVLCLCLLVPVCVTAFAENEETQIVAESNLTLDEYLADCAAKGNSVEVVSSTGDSLGQIGDVFESLSSMSSRTILMKTLAKVINAFSNVLVSALATVIGMVIPTAPVLHDYESFNLDEYGNFYAGMDEFLDEPAEGAKWSLGYSQASILPDDFGEVAYTMGGYGLMATTNETFDGLWVRTIVLNDGSGRGSVAFCVLDAIGIANADVRLIREAVSEFAAENNIVSVNVSVTHTHSGIDLQGVWDNTVTNVLNNVILAKLGLAEVKSGVNRTFLNKIITETSKTIKEAYNSMEEGSLTLAKKDISGYLRDRTAPYVFDGNLYRLMFTPDDETSKPTVIASFSAHPENSGYSLTVISGDFVPYIEEVVNAAGCNFIYIQGCIGTITYQRGATNDGVSDLDRHDEAVRYGHELGYIIMGLTLTQNECKELNYALGDFMNEAEYGSTEKYTAWYRNWKPVAEEEVAPMLNIAHKQFVIENSNKLMHIVGKAGITDYYFLQDDWGRYYTVTEIGYMELGNSLLVELCPGETYGELLMGGEGLTGFKYKSLREMYGENIIVFDLMNDAIAYIEPDDDYVMAGVQYSESKDDFDTDTWCLISWGGHTASTVISEFISLVDSVS